MLQAGYFITAELRVRKTGNHLEAKRALQVLCENTIKEPGCSLFTLHQCTSDPCRFILWERFDNREAFDQHFAEQHTKDYTALNLTDGVQYFQTDFVC